jgi:hypothetical protein
VPTPILTLTPAQIAKLNAMPQAYSSVGQTIDAAALTVALGTFPAGETEWLRLTVDGHDGPDAAGWNVNQLWLNDAGTMTNIANPAIGVPRSTAALATATLVIQDDGAGGLEAVITGVLGQTVEWHLYWHFE